MADDDLTKAARPRVWWSPTLGLVQELPARWPGDLNLIRNCIGGRRTDLPDDAMELVLAPYFRAAGQRDGGEQRG